MTGRLPRRALPRAALAGGAINGLLATVVMTGALLGARRLRLVDVPAPEAVVTGALEQVRLENHVRRPVRTLLVGVAHLGYGTVLGVGYATLARKLGGSSAPRGAAFGLAVWAVDYLGVLPTARILPAPSRQGGGRHMENVAGHLTYGATLGWMSRRGWQGHRPWRAVTVAGRPSRARPACA